MCAKNRVSKHEHQKKDCDRCGFTFLKSDLIKQKGLWVCEDCLDEPSYKETDDG
jgi:formylmethanofuran dehydrogenase subunit E